jgi:hypothetical protein
MNPILSFLRRLWPWPRRRAPPPAQAAPEPVAAPLAEPPPEPAPEAADLVLEPGPAAAPEDAPAEPVAADGLAPPRIPVPEEETPPAPVSKEDEAEEDEAEENVDDWVAEGEREDELEDPGAPDPFISPGLKPIGALTPDLVRKARAEALARAVVGEHRVYLSEAAGPGSLAEALDILQREVRLVSEFRDDDEGPYILYRPAPNPEP